MSVHAMLCPCALNPVEHSTLTLLALQKNFPFGVVALEEASMHSAVHSETSGNLRASGIDNVFKVVCWIIAGSDGRMET